MRLKDGLYVALLLGCMMGLVQASMNYEVRIRTVGRISSVGCGVFSDAACLIPIFKIDWGDVWTGGPSSVVLYVKNTGTTPVTLSYRTENWMPPLAETALTFSWDYDGSVISSLDAVATTFRLDIGAAVINGSAFSFDIVVTAT